MAALAVILALLAARVSTNFGAVDERHNRMFEAFGREMLRPLPLNAKLIVKVRLAVRPSDCVLVVHRNAFTPSSSSAASPCAVLPKA